MTPRNAHPGDALALLRVTAGVTPDRLAAELGVEPAYVRDVEAGLAGSPRLHGHVADVLARAILDGSADGGTASPAV